MLFALARSGTAGISTDIPRFRDAVQGGNDRTQAAADFFNGLLDPAVARVGGSTPHPHNAQHQRREARASAACCCWATAILLPELPPLTSALFRQPMISLCVLRAVLTQWPLESRTRAIPECCGLSLPRFRGHLISRQWSQGVFHGTSQEYQATPPVLLQGLQG